MDSYKNQFNRAVRIGIILLNETQNPTQEDYTVATYQALDAVRAFDDDYSQPGIYWEVEQELIKQRTDFLHKPN